MTKCYIFKRTNAFMEEWKLLAELDSIEKSKTKAMSILKKTPDAQLAIMKSATPARAADIIYLVDYQKGSKYWKDKKMADDHTGFVFNGFGGRESIFIKYIPRKKTTPAPFGL